MKSYILIGVLIVLATVCFIFRIQLNKFLSRPETIKAIKNFCVWADDNIRGSDFGQERLSYVIGKLYNLIPKPLQFFITSKELEKAVNAIFDKIKITMSDGTTRAASEDK